MDAQSNARIFLEGPAGLWRRSDAGYSGVDVTEEFAAVWGLSGVSDTTYTLLGLAWTGTETRGEPGSCKVDVGGWNGKKGSSLRTCVCKLFCAVG